MKLVKSDLFDWGLIPEYSTSGLVPVLKNAPYDGVAVLFGDIRIFEKGFEFDFLILKNPNSLDLQEDDNFHKYLEDVVDEILRSQDVWDKNNKANVP